MKRLLLLLVLAMRTSYGAPEIEPNNSAQAANPIAPGQSTTGQLSSESDLDWFGFSMDGPGAVNVNFDSPTESSIEVHTIQVRNAAGTIFASVNTGLNISFETGLPGAGTYFVVVRDGPFHSFSTGAYGLTITSSASGDPLTIQSAIHTAVEIVGSSNVGRSYVVETSEDMSANSWLPTSLNYPGTGGEMSYFASIRGDAKAFYRVKEY